MGNDFLRGHPADTVIIGDKVYLVGLPNEKNLKTWQLSGLGMRILSGEEVVVGNQDANNQQIEAVREFPNQKAPF